MLAFLHGVYPSKNGTVNFTVSFHRLVLSFLIPIGHSSHEILHSRLGCPGWNLTLLKGPFGCSPFSKSQLGNFHLDISIGHSFKIESRLGILLKQSLGWVTFLLLRIPIGYTFIPYVLNSWLGGCFPSRYNSSFHIQHFSFIAYPFLD